MKLIFFGPPGAGKGTLAARVCELYSIPHISTGEIFRAAIREQSPLGKKVSEIISSGGLVSDEVTFELVKERLARGDTNGGFILDGYPRTIPQAEMLARIASIDAVINFDISDADVIKRLSGRRSCSECGENYHVEFMPPPSEGVCGKCGTELSVRDDDRPESITNRLNVYHEQTQPLLDYYIKKGLVKNIDARPDTDTVLASFKKALSL